ncbi:hypothetical protein [uncultured Veillonella sp.]|uniref:hypothetical protein n=1 Tax=uncultured Veillonella sp. TaxID=159268 RepID=UPI002625AFF5|nr:hypothetical protein [uncultured Veillonella sp.]
MHGNGKAGILLVATGGSHPETLLDHFDYLMTRLNWTNLGSYVLQHTDYMDMMNIPEIIEAYELGKNL